MPKSQTKFRKPNAKKKAKFEEFGVKKANMATLVSTSTKAPNTNGDFLEDPKV